MTANTQSEPSTSSDSTATSSTTGLILSVTEPIRSFLTSSSTEDSNLPDDLRKSAFSLSSQASLPYSSLRSIWLASYPASRPSLSVLHSGSSFLFVSPKPREKCEELKERLKKLEELAEWKAYAELVKDITPQKQTDEPFSSYKDQFGFEFMDIASKKDALWIKWVDHQYLKGKTLREYNTCGDLSW